MFLVYCFVRSYRIISNSHLIIVTEVSSQTRTVGAFRKLNNGDECGWRHSSSHTVQDRKATHSAAGIISAAPVMSAQPITRPAVTEALMTDATPPNSTEEVQTYQLEVDGESRQLEYSVNQIALGF